MPQSLVDQGSRFVERSEVLDLDSSTVFRIGTLFPASTTFPVDGSPCFHVPAGDFLRDAGNQCGCFEGMLSRAELPPLLWSAFRPHRFFQGAHGASGSCTSLATFRTGAYVLCDEPTHAAGTEDLQESDKISHPANVTVSQIGGGRFRKLGRSSERGCADSFSSIQRLDHYGHPWRTLPDSVAVQELGEG